MFIKRITILTLALGLAGCANSTDSTAQANAKAEDDGLICKMEKPTGSNIATRVCRTPEEIKAEQQKAKDAMQSMTRGGVREDS